ncbi:MAG: ABC transporter permease [Actinomycetia bacterium]|nr:ABC transporter permease [Actinomycetes bacterium]
MSTVADTDIESPLIVEEILEGDTPTGFRPFVRSMPWTIRIASVWLLITLAAALGAWIVEIFNTKLPGLTDPNYNHFIFEQEPANQGPSAKFWLGTDKLARDVFSRLVYGTRVSVTVALTAVAFGLVLGGFLGSLVGMIRGRTETGIMALVDVILGFPPLILLLVMVSIFETRSLMVISAVIGVLSIAPYTRVARANALSAANREYVMAARAIGAKPMRVLFREIIPNVVPALTAYAFVAAAVIMVVEGSLAFLGLSVQPPDPTWGSMIFEARGDMRQNIWPLIYPSAVMVFTVLALNVVGDWLFARNAARAAALD